ncbi:MAG: peptide ABC transporter substrate-binding protein [Xanthomonadales bacterium]|nr:peptide ABC transporter substrate-binding protein [Xanthomonadales bacterium]
MVAAERRQTAITSLGLRWLLALLLAAPLAARTLERGNGPEPDSLDPQRAQGLSAQQVLRDLYEGLLRDDADGRLVPGAAERYQISADGREYRFWLHADGRYADGAPLTAQDFVYALGRALDPATAAPSAALLLPIAGAAARLRGEHGALGVEALDTRTLRIRLERPRSDFLRRLALPVAMPVRRAEIEAHGMTWTRPGRLVGNGAYVLREWTPQASLRLERNPHYRRAGEVAMASVRYHVTEDAGAERKRFLAGELHLTETLPPGQLARLRAQHAGELVVAPAYATFYLGYNLRQRKLADPRLRAALSLAIDRERLVRHITGTGETAAYALLPPAGEAGARMAEAALSQAAREQRARELYAAAGHSPAQPLRIELRYNTSLANRRIGLAVAAMWQQVLGLDARLRNEEWKVFVQTRRAGAITEVFRGGWFADYIDPLNFLEPLRADSALNTLGWRDPAYDALLDAAAADTGAAREEALRAAEQRLLDAHALIPLFHYSSKHLVSREVCGFRAHPLDHHPSEFLRWCAQAGAHP